MCWKGHGFHKLLGDGCDCLQVGKLCLRADTKRWELSVTSVTQWLWLQVDESWGVGNLNLQQLSSVLSGLCPGMLAEDRVRAFGVWKLFNHSIGKDFTHVYGVVPVKKPPFFFVLFGATVGPGILGSLLHCFCFCWEADVGLLFWRFSGSGGFSYEQLEAALKEERSAAAEHLLLRGLPAQPLNLRFRGREPL